MLVISGDTNLQRGESYFDYLSRLFENKHKYKINCEDISKLMNAAFLKNCTESKYRKEWKSFNAGRQYERGNQYGAATKILAISDLHCPYNLPIDTFSDYVGKVDILVLNGDITDCQALSKYEKVYRSSPMDEIIVTRQYVMNLIQYLIPSKVVITYGNHDVRLKNYLAKNIDCDISDLLPQTPLELIFIDGFSRYNRKDGSKTWFEPLKQILPEVEFEYTSNWFCQIGDAIFAHPLAFNSGILKTSENALYWFRNEGYKFTSLILAHTHRVGSYAIGNSMIYEQGCCCDISRMEYSNGKLVNSQKEGFIYILQDKNGKTIRDKTKQIILN